MVPVERVDFLIIGSGVAGLSAALEACRLGDVLLISKNEFSNCNSYEAQGGIAAAIGEHDSPLLHYRDTIRAGAGITNQKAIRILTREAPASVRKLIELGVCFDTREDTFDLGREAAHSRSRIIHAGGDSTGREVLNVLLRQARKAQNLVLRENVLALDFILEGERVTGLWCLKDGRISCILAGAILLASGGAGQLYSRTTNFAGSTADGIAMAYRAGCTLTDMEFFQFHPTSLMTHESQEGSRLFLLSEALRGAGAVLKDSEGYPFMPDYHPMGDLASRDVVSRAIFAQMKKKSRDFVYLDISAVSNFEKRFPKIFETCSRYRIDLSTNLIPVHPAAHYIMGGVLTDLDGGTTLPGLFAAGETACTGVHGANRLASNSLLEGLVFGTRMARAAALYRSQKRPLPEPPDMLIPILEGEKLPPSPPGISDGRPRILLKKTMWEEVGVTRTAESLRMALEYFASAAPEGSRPEDLELKNMHLAASLMATAASLRCESRGAHFRSDYPRRRREWKKHILLNIHGGVTIT